MGSCAWSTTASDLRASALKREAVRAISPRRSNRARTSLFWLRRVPAAASGHNPAQRHRRCRRSELPRIYRHCDDRGGAATDRRTGVPPAGRLLEDRRGNAGAAGPSHSGLSSAIAGLRLPVPLLPMVLGTSVCIWRVVRLLLRPWSSSWWPSSRPRPRPRPRPWPRRRLSWWPSQLRPIARGVFFRRGFDAYLG